MESFYGGRQGTSFVIKKTFKYLDPTDPAYIADGITDKNLTVSGYCENIENKDFWYGEYCLVDTTNKNNPANGKIFRRTIAKKEDLNNDSYDYAEYIGQIVGPSAGVPMLNIRPSLLTPTELQNDLGGDWDGLGWEDAEGNRVLYDPSVSPWLPENGTSTIKTALGQLEAAGISGIPETQSFNLVPGYTPATNTEPARYNDTIRYNWYNVRKNTEDNAGVVESWCYIGMEIPYTVFTENYKTIHSNEINVYETEKSKQHTFWYDYMFEIPRGQRGISVVEIFTNESLDENGKVQLDKDGNPILIDVEAYNEKAEIIYNTENNEYTVKGELKTYNVDKGWFCKLQIFNPQPVENKYSPSTPEEPVFYIGASTEIKNILFNTDTGHFEIQYNNRASSTWELNYPKSVKFTDDTGEYVINYSVAADSTGQFGFVKEVAIYEDENAQDSNNKGRLKFINTKEDKTQVFDFTYTENVAIENNGKWSVSNFGKEDESGHFVFPTTINTDDNGNVTYQDSAGNSKTAGQLKYVTKIYTDNPSADGKVYYDTTTETKKEAGQLNYVTAMYMDNIADDGMVYYDTTATEKNEAGKLIFVDDVHVNSAHELLVAYTDNSRISHNSDQEVVIGDKTYINYGQTISDSFGVESSSITAATIEEIISQFNTTYPNGVVNGEVSGILYVVTTNDEVNPKSYFVMWNPAESQWTSSEEIAAQSGIAAKKGSAEAEDKSFTVNTYTDKRYAEGALCLVEILADNSNVSLATPWK